MQRAGCVSVALASRELLRMPACDDLAAAIRSGHIAAAGLDCFVTEPGGNPAFADHANIFMLPHIGSATRETRDAMGFRALDNLDAFFAGREPRDRLV